MKENVRALRRLAQRLAGADTRPPDIDPLDADKILRGYIALPLRVQLDYTLTEGKGIPDLSNPDKIMSHILRTGQPLTGDRVVGLKISGDCAGIGHRFWQDVFLSLIDERGMTAGVPRMLRAAAAHGQGKPSRRVVCKKCQMKLWRASADPEMLREQDRKHQAELRAERKRGAEKK